MTRNLMLLVALLALLASGAPPRPVAAASADWSDIESEFKKGFRPGTSSRAEREGALEKVARSKDGRGVKLLMLAWGSQRKHTDDLFEAWEAGMAEWKEKTSRMESQREEAMRKHRERYEKKGEAVPPFTVNLASEEGRWLGAPPKHPGRMVAAHEKLMRQYDEANAERRLLDQVRMGAARILKDIEGEEFDRAVGEVIRAAEKGKGFERAEMIATLGFVRGDAVTKTLEEQTRERDPLLVEAALEALGRQNTVRGKEILLGFLGHEDWQLRSASLEGLVFYRDPEVIEALLAQAEKEEGVVRRRIFQTMSSIVSEPVKAIVMAWQSWWPANKADVLARWERVPREPGPVWDDPPKLPILTESNDGGTSFYGIETDSKHIIFVADVSGSMSRQENDPPDQPAKIDVCRDELKRALRGLSAVDEDERGAATFNIVLFSTDVLVFKEGRMVVATGANKEKAFKWIDEHVQPQMQTNIYDAIEQAFNIISGSSDRKNRQSGADTMFLMTDGAPSRGKFVRPEVILQEVNRLNRTRGITIHTIGVGKNHNKAFLERLAADNGGQYLAR